MHLYPLKEQQKHLILPEKTINSIVIISKMLQIWWLLGIYSVSFLYDSLVSVLTLSVFVLLLKIC